MTYLYIDSSNFLTLGLLGEDFSWDQYVQTDNLKSSSKLHSMIYQMLAEKGQGLKDIKGLLLAAGPGSYTGIRLSEGFAQILEWQDFLIYSFYHFEVPYILGEASGVWCSQAFKGEFFFYEWEGESNKHKLLNSDQFHEEISKHPKIYTHYSNLLDGDFSYTSKLIEENSQVFFSKIKERGSHLDPFYFRSLEQEFKVPGRPI